MQMEKQIYRLLVLIVPVFIQHTSFSQGVIKAESGARIVSQTGSYWVVDGGNFTLTSQSADNPASFANLKIEAEASLTIEPQSYLTVSGTLTNSVGITGLVIQSNATGSGSLINSTDGVSATVERWMSGDIWHLISPTATSQSAAAFINDADNGIASNTTNYGLAPYKENTNTWNYFKKSGIVGVLDTIAKGYQVLRNADGIVSFKGILAGGDKTIEISRSSYGWNLIGNPYPCALDIELFLANTGNIAAIEPSYLGIYVADVNNFGYIAINSSNGANDLKLASGEAFFVKSALTSGSISFTASNMKSHTSDAFKSAVIQNGFNLVAESAGNKMSTTVKYIPQMTAGLDPGWDAGLFDNGDETSFNLFTELVEDNGVDFTIQCLPDYDYENLVVPVGITAQKGATVEFSLADITVPVGYKVFLEDKVSGKFTRLDEQGSSYSVQLNAISNGTGRFFLHTKQEITGMKDGLSNQILVIPMPQQSIIRVSGIVNLPAQATVYDMNGRMIAIKNLTGLNENEIPLQGVSNGIYLIKIKSDKETTQRKFSWSL
jgi:hypothetical protein